MTEQRLHGYFDWYKNNGDNSYGVIFGEDHEEYFAHVSGHPAIDEPKSGMRVTFLARPRSRGKQGLEAYDVQLDPAYPVKSRTGFMRPTIEARPSPAADVQVAAQEALKLKRLRKEGLAAQPSEDLPPGTRVAHPTYGTGVVVLATRDTLSIRLDRKSGWIVDVERAQVTRVEAKPVTVAPIEQPAPESVETPAVKVEAGKKKDTLGSYISRLASDVHQKLTEEGAEGNGIYRFEEAVMPADAPQPIVIDPRIAEAFRTTSNITEFYSHQVKSRQTLLQGKSVIISTPTASGKTEAYNPTVLETLVNDRAATALYVFPLVALGLDQTERLEKLNRALPEANRLRIGIYNGSVSEESKKETLRADNRILVTTPDSLHYIFLAKPYPNWRRFYQNLRYVVIDEAHIYKGILGANMANIIRRLLVRCRREGNPRYPQIIISSATVRHPGKLAHQLTGLPETDFELITESGAPKPGRHFLVTRSDVHELEPICSDLLTIKTANSKGDGSHFVSTIVFLRSINEVKASARALRNHLARSGRRDEVALVEEYYADKSNKVDVLTRLRQGEVRCLFTTTALMAGIDIGSLDVAIVKNFPGLIMDARQMFGRAGRASEGAVIFVANRTDPFDQFYFDRPSQLFQGPVEDVVANPENPVLLAAHLKCAAQTDNGLYNNKEGPLPGQWASLFGQMGKDLLDLLISMNSLRVLFGNYYLDAADPHDLEPLNDIRSVSGETYTLQNYVDYQLLEEKREETAFRDAHPEAIVWVNGGTYRVVEFDTTLRTIQCEPIDATDLRTKGLEEVEIKIISTDPPTGRKPALGGGATLESGEISITTSVQDYLLYKSHTVMQCRARTCRYETPDLETRRCPKCGSPVRPKQIEKVVDKFEVPTPPTLSRSLKTRACWITFPDSLQDRFEKEFWPRWVLANENEFSPVTIAPDFEHALHSLKHAILKSFPEYIPCDRDEIGGVYQLGTQETPTRLFIYDNFQGGLGLSDEFQDEARASLEGALKLIEGCTCIDDQGCPVCLAYFRCHNLNQSLSKLAGRYLINVLLGNDPSKVLADLQDYLNLYIPVGQQINVRSTGVRPTIQLVSAVNPEAHG